MKSNTIKSLIIILVALLGIYGCKKDKQEVSKFTYKLKDYIINYGSLTSYGVSGHTPPTYKVNLSLAGPGISFDNTLNDFKGKGNFIGVTMYSPNLDFVETGSYVFDGFSSKDSLTFDNGIVRINYDFASKTGDSVLTVKTGIVHVVKRGNVYELNLNLFTMDDKQIKGYFSGFLENHTPPLVAK